MPKTDNVRQVDLPRSGSGGSVYIRGGNAGGVSNADTVDGYHASSTPTAGKLLALDASAQFAPSVIEWADVAGAGLDDSGDTLVVLWGDTPTTIQPDDVAAGGSAAASARSDHRHSIATDVAGSIQPGDTVAEGTAKSFSRSDHRHAITTAAPSTDLSATSTNAESGTSFARGAHTHAITAYADADAYKGHLLKSDVNGDLKVHKLSAADRVDATLVVSPAGTGLTLQPTTDLVLDPDSNLAKVASGVRLQSDGYVSQTTGWGVAYNGAADFRYLYVDEMHAKAFVADLEQALAGGQIIAKSVAPLQSDFTVPAPGATADLWVESFAGFPAAQVFQNGDTVMVRTFSRTGTSLTIGNAFGTVSGAFIVSGEGRQRWTFTRLSGTVNGHPRGGYMAAGTVVPRGTLALDFGVSGNGYYEVSAIDGAMGANSPYAQIVTWNAHPWYDRTVRSRYGNLYGVFASAGEYGMFAGDGAANADQFLRLSNQAIEGHNLPIRLYDGATQVARIEPNAGAPYIGLGNPAPTSYLGATGIWMGKHSTAYKAHVGTVSGGDVTAGWKWDGSTLTVRGQIYVTGGDAAKTDLSNVAANTVTGKVNADSTLIQPGRILISGSTTLDDWRYGNSTMIDGGDIYAGTITAQQVTLAPHNMVANASFETGSGSYIPGWIRNQLNPVITTVAHTGSQSISVTANGSANIDVAHQDFLVSAGDAFYFEGWMRMGTAPPADATAGFTVRWLDSGETILRSDFFLWTSRYTWSKRGGVLIAPANADKVRIYLDVRESCDANTDVKWDDVVFMRASAVGLHIYDPTQVGGYIRIVPEEIAGYDSVGSKQFYLKSSNGRAMFGGGKGVLDRTGLMLSGSETSSQTYNALRWLDGTLPAGDEIARLSAGKFETYLATQHPSVCLLTNPDEHFAYGTTVIETRGYDTGTSTTIITGTRYEGYYSAANGYFYAQSGASSNRAEVQVSSAVVPSIHFTIGGAIPQVYLTSAALTSSVAISASAGGTFSNSTENCLSISRAAGNIRGLRWYSGTSLRWQIGVDNTAESGSNVGSDYAFWTYNDSGSFIAKVAAIARSTGNAWFVGDVSAATFTDHTPYPDRDTALAAVRLMRQAKRPTGELDHEALHEYVRSNNGNEPGRNLSATVSAQNVVIQDLLDRIERLEKGVRT